ncbi:MAG TPA: hypothetical protein VEB67_01110, partial [Nitrososphaerales archaeon]|nr:hypothetical protein [Nitrososphaerales archaeon]
MQSGRHPIHRRQDSTIFDFSIPIEIATLAFSIPVLALEYYWVILLGYSTKYPRDLEAADVKLPSFPSISVLIATFNEKYVIER